MNLRVYVASSLEQTFVDIKRDEDKGRNKKQDVARDMRRGG